MMSTFRRRFAAITASTLALLIFGSTTAHAAPPKSYVRFAHSAKCLEIPAWSIANGTQADQWSCVAQNNALWYVEHKFDNGGTSYFWMRNVHSGKCLIPKANSQSNGAAVIQTTCVNDQAPFYWSLPSAGDGYARIKNLHSGKCINIQAAGAGNGAKALQWTCGVAAQNDKVLIFS